MAEWILLPISKGAFVKVDKADAEFLNQFKWAVSGSNGRGTYAVASVGYGRKGRKNVYMHRLLADVPEGSQVDHINGDGLDNRRSNLRAATQSQNNANCAKRKNARSVYKGVSWGGNKNKLRPWCARVCKDGRTVYRGSFSDEVDAAKAYDVAAVAHFGEFARVNFA